MSIVYTFMFLASLFLASLAVRVVHGKGLVEAYSTNFVEGPVIRGTLAYSHSIRGILDP